MSPNTTPSAPTISAGRGLAWSCGLAVSSAADEGVRVAGAMMSNAAMNGGGARRFAPPPSACQRAKAGPVATKALDLRTAGARPWRMADARCMAAHADVSDPRLYREDSWRPHFARLRREDPVHRHEASPYGPYWSVTRYADIMRVELDHGSLFVGVGAGRHPDRRPAQGPGAAQLHPHGPAAPHRSAQDGGADRGALQPRQHGRRRSASAPKRCSTACRATSRSTGSTVSRPSSPR